MSACNACGRWGKNDKAHIRSRGAGGDESDHNLLNLCRTCHTFQHAKGFLALCEKYPPLLVTLHLKGWYFDLSLGIAKLRHRG